jgi:hypothetical protein
MSAASRAEPRARGGAGACWLRCTAGVPAARPAARAAWAGPTLLQRSARRRQLGNELDVQPLRDPAGGGPARARASAARARRYAGAQRALSQALEISPQIRTCCSGRRRWRWSRTTGPRASVRHASLGTRAEARRPVPAQLDHRASPRSARDAAARHAQQRARLRGRAADRSEPGRSA